MYDHALLVTAPHYPFSYKKLTRGERYEHTI